jgi:3-phosphoshikimate 1-carboxyvinyltransferase
MMVKVFPSEIKGEVVAPASKSYTHRAIVLSLLASGKSTIYNPLISRDTLASVNGCRLLGANIKINEVSKKFEILSDGIVKTPNDVINVENSGTTIRFLTAVSAIASKGYAILTGDDSIRRRPMQPLLNALSFYGVKAWSSRDNGLPPIIVKCEGIDGGEGEIRADISSQFISALLISLLKARKDSKLKLKGKIVSSPYIDATVKMIELFNGVCLRKGNDFEIPANQELKPISFKVPGDFSSASFLLACGALFGEVKVNNLTKELPQADFKIIEILKKMGAEVRIKEDLIVVKAGELKGGRFNLKDCPDLLPVVSVLAIKAKGDVEIYGVQHARYKETDRISVIAKELGKMNVKIIEKEDGLVIRQDRRLCSATLNSYNDHRLFMAFVIASMLCKEPCYVKGLEAVDISYPSFIKDLKSLGARIEVLR